MTNSKRMIICFARTRVSQQHFTIQKDDTSLNLHKNIQMKTIFFYLVLLIFLVSTAMAQQKINRKDLLSEKITAALISKVDVKEITLGPTQKAPLHQHPCAVFGYVAEGELLFQIRGHKPQLLKQGDAFYEPAETAIEHFDNASADHQLKFIAFYLHNDEKELIELLPDKQ